MTTTVDVTPVHHRIGKSLSNLQVVDYIAIGFLLLVLLAAVAPGLLSPDDPLEPVGAILEKPSPHHLFGTDYLGRDLLSRVVYGTVRTLAGSGIAVSIGFVVGSLLGLCSAYLGRTVDLVVGRLIDVLLSIPGLLLALVIVVSLGSGSFNSAIAVGIASIATFTRLMRSEALTVKNLPYVEAARHIGQSRTAVLFRHILPNALGSVLSLFALQFGAAILWIASLGFLGYGAPPPQPEWGILVTEGRDYLSNSPWLALFPGLVIILTVVALGRVSTLVSDWLGRYVR